MKRAVNFVGREKELNQLRRAYAEGRHLLIVGLPGIGKTALLRQIAKRLPIAFCEDTSSLGAICQSIEGELGWVKRNTKLVERKNRLFSYLKRRGKPVALDAVANTRPRVARFVAQLAEFVPIWIACRSSNRQEVGAVWEHLYNFKRIDLTPFSRKEAAAFIEGSMRSGRLPKLCQDDIVKLHRLAKGNPRVLKELLSELALREYRLEDSFSRKLLDLDRRIHHLAAIAQPTIAESVCDS